MEVSGHIDAPGKGPSTAVGQEVGWAPVFLHAEKKISYESPESNTKSFDVDTLIVLSHLCLHHKDYYVKINI
jgi:hypothetical protein